MKLYTHLRFVQHRVSRSEATKRSGFLLRAGFVSKAKINSWKVRHRKTSAFVQSQNLHTSICLEKMRLLSDRANYCAFTQSQFLLVCIYRLGDIAFPLREMLPALPPLQSNGRLRLYVMRNDATVSCLYAPLF